VRATRKFTDREDHKKLFDRLVTERADLLVQSLAEDKPIQGKVLVFYGIGGVGKTRLRGEFEGMLRDRKSTHPHASVEFKEEKLQINKALFHMRCALVSGSKIPFPSFDFAHLAWWKKANPGQAMHQEDVSILGNKGGDIGSFLNTAGDLFLKGGLLRDAAENLPMLGNMLVAGDYVWRIVKYLGNRYKGREFDFTEIKGKEAHEIEKMLPDYFADDLVNWVGESKSKAMPVLFLDNFEALTENRSEGEALLADKWVRDLIEMLPEALWVIMTRNYLDWHERNPEQWEGVLDQHLLDKLTPADAEKFLLSCEIADQKVREAIVRVSTVPLFLDIAVDTAELIRTNDRREPGVEDFAGLPPEGKEELVERFMRYLEGPQATALKTLSVPRFFTLDLAKELVDRFTKFEWQNWKRDIARFSFVNEREGQVGVYELHQDVRQIFLGRLDPEERKRIERFVFEHYDEELKGLNQKDLYEHHIVVLEEAFHHGKEVMDISKFMEWFCGRRAPFDDAAKFHSTLISLHKILLEKQETELGREHKDIADTLHHLGMLYRKLGQYKEASHMLSSAVENARGNLLETLSVEVQYLLDLGDLEEHLNHYEEAKRIYQEAQRIWLDRKGKEESGEYALILANLASVEEELAHYKEAHRLMRRAWELRKKVYPEGNPKVGHSMLNVARLLRTMNQLQEALPLIREAVDYFVTLYKTEDHPDVAVAFSNLGDLYKEMGEYKKAEECYRKALSIRESVYPAGHESIGWSKNDLALLYQQMNRYKEARDLFEALVALRKELYKTENHPAVATAISNLGDLYEKMGEYKKAEECYRKALSIRESVYPAGHESIGWSKNDLALLYQQMNRYKEARDLFEALVALSKELYKTENHPTVATAISNLGDLYKEMGEYKKAEECYRGALKILESILPKGHSDISNLLNALGWMFIDKTGEPSKALPILRKAVSMEEKTLGSVHPRLGHTIDSLASALRDLGQFEESEKLYLRALGIWLVKKGSDNRDQKETLGNIALLYKKMGRQSDAADYLEKAIRMISLVNGPGDISIERLRTRFEAIH